MSSLLGVFQAGDRSTDESVTRAILAAMQRRGADHTSIRNAAGGALAVARADWEADPEFSHGVQVEERADLLLVADATLYYRGELEQSLNAVGVRPRGPAPGQLILAAYEAWGESCPERLEGDYAFIAWDRHTRRVFCARDFGGKRPLYYAHLGETLIIASSVSAVAAHPDCPEELDLQVLAATASGLFTALGSDTCYRAIKTIPPGANLTWSPNSGPRVMRHWEPPHPFPKSDRSFEAAAEELRLLLERAVDERMGSSGTTAVWMSGGWDSTAVFAAGQNRLRHDSSTRRLIPVSISYPTGDPGREDDLIAMVANHWDSPIHWLQSRRIPLFEGLEVRAADRDQPAAHLYERWNEALARGSRDCGARIAFDGNGGDQLFQVSNVYLTDLLLRGRLIPLAKEWRARRMGWKELLRWALLPALPDLLRRAVAISRSGGDLRAYLQRPIPPWIREDRVTRGDLRQRELADLPHAGVSSRADAETRWYLESCVTGLGISYIAEVALTAGIELRSPLYDRRIVEFALSRPRSERASVAGTKHLLRRAMRELLPAEFLAPRARRTGVTTGYSRMWMRRRFPQLFQHLFRRPLILEELGIVDSSRLKRSLELFLSRGGEFERVSLYHTLQTEVWLRMREVQGVTGMEPAPLAGKSPAT